MTIQDIIALGQLIATTVAGVAGIILTAAIYRLSARQREDTWQHHFAGIHDHFWSDEDFQTVRAWLACPSTYKELGEVLAKRRDDDQAATLTSKEYEHLDKLDKFLNLMTRVIALDTGVSSQKKLLDTLFFSYWLKRAIGRTADDTITHENLYWYVERFYPSIINRMKSDMISG